MITRQVWRAGLCVDEINLFRYYDWFGVNRVTGGNLPHTERLQYTETRRRRAGENTMRRQSDANKKSADEAIEGDGICVASRFLR